MAIGPPRKATTSTQTAVNTDPEAGEPEAGEEPAGPLSLLVPVPPETHEEVDTLDKYQKGQDFEFRNSVISSSTIQAPDNVEDYNAFLRRNHQTMADTFIKPSKSRGLACSQLTNPRTSISAGGAVSWPVKTTEVFDNLIAPFPQVSVALKGLILDSFELTMGCTGTLDASNLLSSATCAGAVATSASAIELSSTSKGEMMSGALEVVSFSWSPDAAIPSWSSPDKNFVGTTDTAYILAIRVKYVGFGGAPAITGAANELIPVFLSTLTLGLIGSQPAWRNLDDVLGDLWATFTTPAFFPKTNGDTILPSEFVGNPGGGNLVAGKFLSTTPFVSVPMNPGDETELWYAIQWVDENFLSQGLVRMDGSPFSLPGVSHAPSPIFWPELSWFSE